MGASREIILQGGFSRLEGLPREVSTPELDGLGVSIIDTTGPYTYQFRREEDADICLMGTVIRRAKPGQANEERSEGQVEPEPELFDVVSVFGGQANEARTYITQEISPPLETEEQRLAALGRLVVLAGETLGWIDAP